MFFFRATTLASPNDLAGKHTLWKFDICGEMNPLDIFYIGESELVFHLDGELNHDG